MSERVGLDIGSRVIYRGEFGTITGVEDGPPGPYWIVRLDNGATAAPLACSPYLAPLNRHHFLRAILNSVGARHLDTDTAARILETVGV